MACLDDARRTKIDLHTKKFLCAPTHPSPRALALLARSWKRAATRFRSTPRARDEGCRAVERDCCEMARTILSRESCDLRERLENQRKSKQRNCNAHGVETLRRRCPEGAKSVSPKARRCFAEVLRPTSFAGAAERSMRQCKTRLRSSRAPIECRLRAVCLQLSAAPLARVVNHATLIRPLAGSRIHAGELDKGTQDGESNHEA